MKYSLLHLFIEGARFVWVEERVRVLPAGLMVSV